MALAAALLLGAPAKAQPGHELRLPTQADGQAAATTIENILNGPRGVETRLPGPASDEEAITVGVGLDGSPVSVHVVQRLVISGLGDFQFKIPGPARDVEALAGSESEPGLRKGAVLWQGFSPGTKHLGASMELYPDLEAGRLPVRLDLQITVDGRPVDPGRPVSGEFEIHIRLVNQTPIPIGISSGDADPEAVIHAINAVRSALVLRRRPVPGEDRVPTSIDVTGPTQRQTVTLEAPMHFSGSVRFPAGGLVHPSATSADVTVRADRTLVSFSGQVGGGAPLEQAIVIRGEAKKLTLPHLRINVVPAPPLADALSNLPARVPDRVAALMRAMWEVARLRQFDAYLGNPDPTGPAVSSFRYVLSPPTEAAAATPVGAASPVPVLLGLSLGGFLALFGLAWLWSRS